MKMLGAPKIPRHCPAVLNSGKEGMEKDAFLFYCQLIGLGTVPHPSQVLIQGATPRCPEKVQKHFPWGNPQTRHSQAEYSCHQSEKRHIRETKRRARDCEKRKGTQSLDASSESVQMFRTDSGLGSAASFPQKGNKSAPALKQLILPPPRTPFTVVIFLCSLCFTSLTFLFPLI